LAVRHSLEDSRDRSYRTGPSGGRCLSSAPLDGERKTVTALLADIKGSMDLIEDLPVEARAIVDPALKLTIER